MQVKTTKQNPLTPQKSLLGFKNKKQQTTLGAGHACLQQAMTGTFNKDNQLNIKSTENNTVTTVVLYKVKTISNELQTKKSEHEKRVYHMFREAVFDLVSLGEAW